LRAGTYALARSLPPKEFTALFYASGSGRVKADGTCGASELTNVQKPGGGPPSLSQHRWHMGTAAVAPNVGSQQTCCVLRRGEQDTDQ